MTLFSWFQKSRKQFFSVKTNIESRYFYEIKITTLRSNKNYRTGKQHQQYFSRNRIDTFKMAFISQSNNITLVVVVNFKNHMQLMALLKSLYLLILYNRNKLCTFIIRSIPLIINGKHLGKKLTNLLFLKVTSHSAETIKTYNL